MIRTLYKYYKNWPLLKNILFKISIKLKNRGIVLGKKNKIQFNNCSRLNNKIHIVGNSNLISFYNSEIVNCSFKISGDNCIIKISENTHLNGTEFHIENNNVLIEIGKNCFIGRSHIAAVEDFSKIIIGDNCLISSNVYIRTSDSHGIYDRENNERLNFAKSIFISSKVWIAEGAKILKGVSLGEEIVVSSGAVVTKSFKKKQLDNRWQSS